MDLLLRLDHSSFSLWVKQSGSLFAFPGILLLHTIGMALVVGIIGGIDLRILGFAAAVPLAPMQRFLPIVWVGLGINAVSGVIMLIADASNKLANPDFWIKMVFIAFAVINLRMIQLRVFGDPHLDQKPLSARAQILAATSLFFWLGAITAGRLLAYVGPGLK